MKLTGFKKHGEIVQVDEDKGILPHIGIDKMEVYTMSKKAANTANELVSAGRLNADGYGDLVRCIDCDTVALMPIGGTECVRCQSENLAWVDMEKPEWTVEELIAAGYVVTMV